MHIVQMSQNHLQEAPSSRRAFVNPSIALGQPVTLWHALTPRSATQCFIDDSNWLPGESLWHSLSGGSVILPDLLEA